MKSFTIGATRNIARTLIASALLGAPAVANTYYVSASGSDANNGLSAGAAFLNIQTAANLTVPGDTVYVMSGTYAANPALWHEAVVTIANSGTAAQPITFSAYPGQHPIITTANNPKVWEAVQIVGSYINFVGFEVVGTAQSVTLAGATATAAAEVLAFAQSTATHAINPTTTVVYPSDVATNGNCISVEGATHVTVKRNLVHDCSASGISVEKADYFLIESNIVFNTSWWTVYDTSGINIHYAQNSDNLSTYKNFILNNISHDNGNTQAYYNVAVGNGVPTDGNGIIIDTNQVTTNGQPYLGRTLVMANIVYNNGGSGMHAYSSAHVDFFNNTAYMNNNCPVPGSTCGSLIDGEIFAAVSTDVNIYNNIMYSPVGKRVYSNWENTSVSEDNNIMYSPGGVLVIGNNYTLSKNDIVADPQFNNPAFFNSSSASPAVETYDIANPTNAMWVLRLMKASRGRNAGTGVLDSGAPMLVHPVGMDGNQDAGIDIGALSAPNSR